LSGLRKKTFDILYCVFLLVFIDYENVRSLVLPVVKKKLKSYKVTLLIRKREQSENKTKQEKSLLQQTKKAVFFQSYNLYRVFLGYLGLISLSINDTI